MRHTDEVRLRNELLSDEEIGRIRQRCDAATDGPWKSYVEGRDHTSGSSFIMTPSGDIELSGAAVADQDFIAHARQDLPRLLAELSLLRRRIAEFEERSDPKS